MHVYKYLSAERIGFLSDGLIRFTQPSDLNDPYECLPSLSEESALDGNKTMRASFIAAKQVEIEQIPEQFRRARWECELARFDRELELNQDLLRNNLLEKHVAMVNAMFGILSLSRRWNSGLMWSHYSESYKGFCVGFDRGHEYFNGVPDQFGEKHPLSPVIYSEVRTQFKGVKGDRQGEIDILFTKSTDWSYEEEERLVALLNVADKVKANEPYPINLYNIPFECISELTVGHRADLSIKKKILAVSQKLEVPAYETKVSRFTFDVERIPLNVL